MLATQQCSTLHLTDPAGGATQYTRQAWPLGIARLSLALVQSIAITTIGVYCIWGSHQPLHAALFI